MTFERQDPSGSTGGAVIMVHRPWFLMCFCLLMFVVPAALAWRIIGQGDWHLLPLTAVGLGAALFLLSKVARIERVELDKERAELRHETRSFTGVTTRVFPICDIEDAVVETDEGSSRPSLKLKGQSELYPLHEVYMLGGRSRKVAYVINESLHR